MMSLSKERKERRLQSYDGMMMTRRGYNAALCGLLLYGIAANFIICKYFTDAVEALNPTAFLIGYLVCAIIGCLMSGLSHSYQNPDGESGRAYERSGQEAGDDFVFGGI